MAIEDGAMGGDFTLTVLRGFGSGTYPAGSEVHVFADVNPYESVVTGWRASTSGVSLPEEWHFAFTMPASDVTLTPRTEAVPMEVVEGAVAGAVNDKRVLYAVPEEPRGVVFLFHGTNGSADIIYSPAAQYLARLAFHRGYIVVSTNAEEVTRGAPGRDGELRWDTTPSISANRDLQNIALISDAVSAYTGLPLDAPRFAVGVSSGGEFSLLVGAALPFAAVSSFCAVGREAAYRATTTPSQWLMCGNDRDDTVRALRPSWRNGTTNLAGRAVATDYDELVPSPMYPSRFARIEGIDPDTSAEMVAELRDNGTLGSDGFLMTAPEDLLSEVLTNASSWPRMRAVSATVDGRLILNELEHAWADHTMHDDWAARCLDFLEAQVP